MSGEKKTLKDCPKQHVASDAAMAPFAGGSRGAGGFYLDHNFL